MDLENKEQEIADSLQSMNITHDYSESDHSKVIEKQKGRFLFN